MRYSRGRSPTLWGKGGSVIIAKRGGNAIQV
jgi:hypothetical protein